MPFIQTGDGVKLYYEEAGSGTPIVFVHEFAADYRSWESPMRHFSRRYRCITYSARGYLPSAVPESVDRYSLDARGASRHRHDRRNGAGHHIPLTTGQPAG